MEFAARGGEFSEIRGNWRGALLDGRRRRTFFTVCFHLFSRGVVESIEGILFIRNY